MTTPDGVATAAARHLHLLADHLQTRDLHVRVAAARSGLPQLILVRTALPSWSEVVYAAQRAGTWWFWWSWAEPIAPVTDLTTAITRIRRLFAASGTRRR
ncbi:hypothetical protein ABGB17_28090 [Sphaerisporangium sp. B11E5]|uniref:hypothetical protein n=1 Tax=Sphaerisporangium sp. B11E5 TaxID=3153563 RepID=UPI00325F680C